MGVKASAATLICSFLISTTAGVQAEECGREALSAIVSEVGVKLTEMNNANTQTFQKKLVLLKKQAGWSDADYVVKATPFVQDERITAFDLHNKTLLAQVPQLGQAGQSVASLTTSAPSTGDADKKSCIMVKKLRALMIDVLSNSAAKWSYMLAKVDAALVEAEKKQASK